MKLTKRVIVYYLIYLAILFAVTSFYRRPTKAQAQAAIAYEQRLASADWRYGYIDDYTAQAIQETTDFLKAYAYFKIKSRS